MRELKGQSQSSSQRASVFIEIAVVLTALSITMALFFGLVPKIVKRQGATESIRALANLRDPLLIAKLTREGATVAAEAKQVIAAFAEHAAVLNTSSPRADFCLFMVQVNVLAASVSTLQNDCSAAQALAFYPIGNVTPPATAIFEPDPALLLSPVGTSIVGPFGTRVDGTLCASAPVPALEMQIMSIAQQPRCLKPVPYYLYAVFDANSPENFDIRSALNLLNLDRCGPGSAAGTTGNNGETGDASPDSFGCCLRSASFADCCSAFPDNESCTSATSSLPPSSSSSSVSSSSSSGVPINAH